MYYLMQKRVDVKKSDVRQNLAECWNSIRNKVEFAEHGEWRGDDDHDDDGDGSDDHLIGVLPGDAGSGHTICAVLIAGLSLLLGKIFMSTVKAETLHRYSKNIMIII